MKAFKQPFTKQRRAILSSADLALTFLILVSITLPTLSHSLYLQTLSSHGTSNAQKLSTLLQEATLTYAYSAAVQNRSKAMFSPLSQGNFAKTGFLSENFPPSAQYTDERRANLSLHSLFYHASSPPPILQKNQICVMRKMLDSSKNPTSIWVCGY